MKFIKNTISLLLLAGFFSSCLPHPSQKPMPPGHDKKVEELKQAHPKNRR